jgi:hypothetical protein
MTPTGRIFIKLGIRIFFENLVRKFRIHKNMTRITSSSLEDQYTFLVISLSILLTVRNVSDKISGGNQQTHFIFNKSSPVTGLEWPRRFQEVKVKHSRYGLSMAHRAPGS